MSEDKETRFQHGDLSIRLWLSSSPSLGYPWLRQNPNERPIRRLSIRNYRDTFFGERELRPFLKRLDTALTDRTVWIIPALQIVQMKHSRSRNHRRFFNLPRAISALPHEMVPRERVWFPMIPVHHFGSSRFPFTSKRLPHFPSLCQAADTANLCQCLAQHEPLSCWSANTNFGQSTCMFESELWLCRRIASDCYCFRRSLFSKSCPRPSFNPFTRNPLMDE